MQALIDLFQTTNKSIFLGIPILSLLGLATITSFKCITLVTKLMRYDLIYLLFLSIIYLIYMLIDDQNEEDAILVSGLVSMFMIVVMVVAVWLSHRK